MLVLLAVAMRQKRTLRRRISLSLACIKSQLLSRLPNSCPLALASKRSPRLCLSPLRLPSRHGMTLRRSLPGLLSTPLSRLRPRPRSRRWLPQWFRLTLRRPVCVRNRSVATSWTDWPRFIWLVSLLLLQLAEKVARLALSRL
jgi:hypothetical protein